MTKKGSQAALDGARKAAATRMAKKAAGVSPAGKPPRSRKKSSGSKDDPKTDLKFDAPSSPPSPPSGKPKAQPKEVDAKQLSAEEAKKRVGTIYKLERDIEAKRFTFNQCTFAMKQARRELAEAEDKLAQEINEQRFGPGPLFDAQPSSESKTI